jgi:Uma2 family endonuclease
MALPTTRTYTVDEFEDYIAQPEHRDRLLELIDGFIVEKAMPTDEHAIIAGLLIYYLTDYAMKHGIGLPGPERRVRVPKNLKNTRMPNVSLIIDPEVPIVTKGATPLMPDVIAEVKSPDDQIDEMRAKAKFYTDNGAKLVWLVFPRPKTVEVYRPNQPSDILGMQDSLDGHDVLPGFSLPVASLFVQKRSG